MDSIREFFFSGDAGDLVAFMLVGIVMWVAWVFGYNRE